MTDLMKSILTEVLSRELGTQERLKTKDSLVNRDVRITEIKNFMVDNDIKISMRHYLDALEGKEE